MTGPRTTYAAGTPDWTTAFAHEHVPSEDGIELESPSETTRPPSPSKRHGSLLQRFIGRAKSVVHDNAGMLLIAASEAFFAPANVAVKALHALDPPVSTMQLIFVRMVITWVCSEIYMYITKVPDPFLGPKGVRLLLVARGLCGFIGLFGVYYPVQYLSLADATVLTFLAPIFSNFTAVYFLGEAFSWRQLAAGFCSLFGVVLIARPPFLFGSDSDGGGSVAPTSSATTAQRLGAVGVALFGTLGATGAYTVIGAIGKRASPMHSIVAFSSQSIVVTAVIMAASRTPFVFPAKGQHMAMLVMIGFCGFLAQVLMTMGLQRGPVGRGTLAVYTQVVYALAFDALLFATPPRARSLLGILGIVASAVYVAASTPAAPGRARGDDTDGALEAGLLATRADGAADGTPAERA